jgi:cysteinyl-tRNA synthetase
MRNTPVSRPARWYELEHLNPEFETTAMPHQLSLYNTLTRTKETFVPIDPKNVRMYVCGPTVYDYAHIGNARPVIVFDVLFRLLRHVYGENHVTYVRNITDVDDKINARAARDYPDLPLNEAIRKVTVTTNKQFQADVAALGNLQPSDQPRATEYIAEMVAMIDRLVERGVAYVADGHVLFSPSAMNAAKGPRYGLLARRSAEDMLAGARVDVASYKRDEMDFVLWKPSRQGEPGWQSPAGIEGLGRPGWHIECSAMSMAKLLEPFGGGLQCDDPMKNIFDIHAGGIDLVFPHHENEIAQSCCALGTDRMANVWMHNGFLQVEGQKMAKSVGNFVTIHELLATNVFGDRKWPGEVLRLAMLMTNYREPIDFSVRKLEEAENILAKAREYVGDAGVGSIPDVAVEILSDDLATPNLINWLASIRKSRVLDPADYRAVFGLLGIDLRAEAISPELENEIEVKICNRLSLLAAKSFAEADRIRDELLSKGIQLRDGKDPATGERVTTWEVKR